MSQPDAWKLAYQPLPIALEGIARAEITERIADLEKDPEGAGPLHSYQDRKGLLDSYRGLDPLDYMRMEGVWVRGPAALQLTGSPHPFTPEGAASCLLFVKDKKGAGVWIVDWYEERACREQQQRLLDHAEVVRAFHEEAP